MPLSFNAAAVALTATVLLSWAGPAAADPDESGQPGPPAAMSTIGGSRLGKPGTQVDLGTASGVPELPDDLTARSWVVADAKNGEILAAHNAHWRLAPASTLKMLFADTLLPKLTKTATYQVKPSDLASVQAGSSLVGIKEDYTYSVHDMWLGVFLASGNDAVHVLSAMNGGVRTTVQQMQAHAAELQADDTHVVSPDGFDQPGQVSSAYDLTLFARSGLQKPDFREYCSTVTAKFPGEINKKHQRETYSIQNTNRLLAGSNGMTQYRGLAGVKNGFTTHAGNTFTGVAQHGDRTLLVTVMHPEEGGNRVYEEGAALLDWGFRAAGKARPVGRLVLPRDRQAPGVPSSKATGGATQGTRANAPQPSAAAQPHNSGGAGSALGLTGVVLVGLGVVVFLVNRRWPLPALMSASRNTQDTSATAPGPAGNGQPVPPVSDGTDGTTTGTSTQASDTTSDTSPDTSE